MVFIECVWGSFGILLRVCVGFLWNTVACKYGVSN